MTGSNIVSSNNTKTNASTMLKKVQVSMVGLSTKSEFNAHGIKAFIYDIYFVTALLQFLDKIYIIHKNLQGHSNQWAESWTPLSRRLLTRERIISIDQWKRDFERRLNMFQDSHEFNPNMYGPLSSIWTWHSNLYISDLSKYAKVPPEPYN